MTETVNQIDPEKKKQLDSNIRKMLESGASQDDVTKYAKDFNAKYNVPKQSPPAGGQTSKSSDTPSVSTFGKQGKNKLYLPTEAEWEAEAKANPKKPQAPTFNVNDRSVDSKTIYRNSGKTKPVDVQDADRRAAVVGVSLPSEEIEDLSELRSNWKDSDLENFYVKDVDNKISKSYLSSEIPKNTDEIYPEYQNKSFKDLSASRLFKPEEIKDIDSNDFRDYLVRSGWANKLDNEEDAFGHIDNMRNAGDAQSQGFKYKILTDYLMEKRNTLEKDSYIYEARHKLKEGDYTPEIKETIGKLNDVNKQLVGQITKFDAVKERADKLSEKEREWRDYLRSDDFDIVKETQYLGKKAWNGVSKVLLGTAGSTLDMLGDISTAIGGKDFNGFDNVSQATDDIQDILSFDVPQLQLAVLEAKDVKHDDQTYQVKGNTIYRDGIRVLDDELSPQESKEILNKSKSVQETSLSVSGREAAAGVIDMVSQLYMMVKTAKALPIKNYTASAGIAGALQTHHDTYTEVKNQLETAIAQGDLDIPMKDVDKLASMNAYMNDVVVASTGMLSPNKPLAGLNREAIVSNIKNLYNKEAGILGKKQIADYMGTVMKESLKEVVQEESELVLGKQINALTNILVNKDVLDTDVTKGELVETALITALGTGLATGKSQFRGSFGNVDPYTVKQLLASKDSGDIANAVQAAVEEGDITPEFGAKLNEQILEVRKYDHKIPETVDNTKRERILPIIRQKETLEAEAKTKDSAFKEMYKEKALKLDEKINAIVNEKPQVEAAPKPQINEQEEQREGVPETGIPSSEESGRTEEGADSSNNEPVRADISEENNATIGDVISKRIYDSQQDFYAASDKKENLRNFRQRLKEAGNSGLLSNAKSKSLITEAANLNLNDSDAVDKFIGKYEKAMYLAELKVSNAEIRKLQKRLPKRVDSTLGRKGVESGALELARLKVDNIPPALIGEYKAVLEDLTRNAAPDFDKASELYSRLEESYLAQSEYEYNLKQDKLMKESPDTLVEQVLLQDATETLTPSEDMKDYERNIISEFRQIPMTWMQSNLSKPEMAKLTRTLNAVSKSGVLFNRVLPDVINKYNAEIAAKEIMGEVGTKTLTHSKSMFGEIQQLIKGKKRSTPEDFTKALSNKLLHNVDLAVRGLRSTVFYNTVIHPVTTGFNKANEETNAVAQELSALVGEAKKSVRGSRVKRMFSNPSENYDFDLNVKLQLLFRQMEFDTAPDKNANKVFDLKDHVAKTIEHGSKTNLSDASLARIQGLYDAYVVDGKFDTGKLQEEFTDAENKLVDFIMRQVELAAEKDEEVSNQRIGKTLKKSKGFFFPRTTTVADNKVITSTETSIAERLSGALGNTSTKPQSLNERSITKAGAIGFNTLGDFMTYVKEANIAYNVSDKVKVSGMTLSNIAAGDNKSLQAFAKGLDKGIKTLIEAQLGNNIYLPQRKRERIFKALVRNTYKKLLISPIRLVNELVTGSALFYSTHLNKLPEMVRLRKMLDDDFRNTLFSEFGSNQAGRIRGNRNLDYNTATSSLLSSKRFTNKDTSIGDKLVTFLQKNKAGDIGDYASELYYHIADNPAKDKWNLTFVEEFEKTTGQKFDAGKFESKDYRIENKKSIQEAITKADNAASLLFNSAASSEQKLNVQANNDWFTRFNNFMRGFTSNESDVWWNSLRSIFGQGTIESKAEAARVFGIITGRSIGYSFMQQVMFTALIPLLMGQDDDDEEYEKALYRSLAQHGLLVTTGSYGTVEALIGSAVVEGANYLYHESKGEKYDPYEDGLTRTLPMRSTLTQFLKSGGAEGEAVATYIQFGELAAKLTDKYYRNGTLTEEELIQLKTCQIVLSATSQTLGIPLTDVGKFYQKSFEGK